MTQIFKVDVTTNLKAALDTSCKKFKFGDKEEEYFCPCGYVKTTYVKNGLEVKSATCGF